jgi:hypothetical protein
VLDPPDTSIVGEDLVPSPFSPCAPGLNALPVLALRGQPKPRQRRQVGRDLLCIAHPRSGPNECFCDALERTQSSSSDRGLNPVHRRRIHASPKGESAFWLRPARPSAS